MSLKEMSLWLDAHVPNARPSASTISAQSTNVTPRLTILAHVSCDCSRNRPIRRSQRPLSIAYRIPPPSPVWSVLSSGIVHEKRLACTAVEPYCDEMCEYAATPDCWTVKHTAAASACSRRCMKT